MPVPPGEFVVGRDDDVHVHLEDASASRRHAKIFNLADGFYIEDLGSVNGTALHGAYITGRSKMGFGDVVHIGSVPFRIDHEVAGEEEPIPNPAGVRPADRSYMKRNTERLPMPGEAPRVIEKIAPDKLAAPVISVSSDIDAEDLNAIVMREPEQMRLPVVKPGLTPLPKTVPPQSSISIPTPQSAQAAALPRRQNEPWSPPSQSSVSAQMSVANQRANASVVKPAEITTQAPITKAEETDSSSPQAVSNKTGWGWLLAIFLAGMGTGLLLGLYFAKLFIEMGGKVAALP